MVCTITAHSKNDAEVYRILYRIQSLRLDQESRIVVYSLKGLGHRMCWDIVDMYGQI
jgi:hypothetical protein